MEEVLSFPCVGCGACCRNVGRIKGFTEPFDEDGVCTHLQSDNSCAIYEDRPLICRVDTLYKDVPALQERYPDKQQYYKENLKGCKLMLNKFGADVTSPYLREVDAAIEQIDVLLNLKK